MGHPDEKILSQVQSIRTFLHRFIFRKSIKYSNLKSFLNDFLISLELSSEVFFF